jgi:hypothetical protein
VTYIPKRFLEKYGNGAGYLLNFLFGALCAERKENAANGIEKYFV